MSGQDTTTVHHQMLRHCCAWGNSAMLVLSDGSARLEGRFHHFGQDAGIVRLHVTSFGRLAGLSDVRLGQYCGVSFVHQDRPFFFLGMISDIFEEDDRPLLEMPLPEVILGEMRRSYRIPVLADCGLHAEMVFEGDEVYQPRVKNLSLTGALLEFDQDADPKLEPYDRIGLQFRFQDETAVSLRGIVRRCDTSDDGRQYGVHFPETAGMEEAPEDLVRLTKHVEKLWLEALKES